MTMSLLGGHEPNDQITNTIYLHIEVEAEGAPAEATLPGGLATTLRPPHSRSQYPLTRPPGQ